MRQYVAKLGALIFVGGCSIIYNPNNITKSIDAAIDMPIDSPVDANAADLTLLDAAPHEIFEGQGTGGSRTAILVIHGSNFVAGASVALTGAATVMVDNTKVAISAGSDYLAVPVTAMIDSSVPADVPLSIQVTQPSGGAMVMKQLDGMVTLHGLPELNDGNVAALANNAENLAPLYSRVMLTGALALGGGASDAGVLIRAVSSVSVATVTERGGNASSSNAGAAGAGGCTGGAGESTGGCDGHGGGAQAGTLGGGGGGGAGFAAMGTTGAGGGAGAGGSVVGDDQIATYVDFMSNKANHAAGGGGGGGSILNAAGGGGGGGGGIVELTAGGDVTCGNIDVGGGNGSNANGAGGGGGAGGVISLRAGRALTAGALASQGGTGGNATQDGGPGAVGRIRWDSPTSSAPSGNPTPIRGPAFLDTTRYVLTPASMSLQLIGTQNRKFDVYTVDGAQQTHTGQTGVSFGADSKATITPPLSPGFNTVCITLQGGMQGRPEADKCFDVAYLP